MACLANSTQSEATPAGVATKHNDPQGKPVVFENPARANRIVKVLSYAFRCTKDACNVSVPQGTIVFANCSINITVMNFGFCGCILTGRSWIGSS